MTVLSAQSIREIRPVSPFVNRTTENGMTYGLGPAGYDIRIDQNIEVGTSQPFILASSMERFVMPTNVLGLVKDKSSWARKGLVVQNTVIEPGWCGYLTLELSYLDNSGYVTIPRGAPIAQIIFQWLDSYTEAPYRGKYQNQPKGPQKAIDEVS